MRVAYLVHDLNDFSVARRIHMLREGGFDVVVAGFWRGDHLPRDVAGAPALSLGRTFDARLAHRGVAALRHALRPRGLRERLGSVDLVLARNLEMLAIAVGAGRGDAHGTPIVYEALDLHRLLLGRSAASRVLRRIERALMRRAALLLTSSPGFLHAYFHNPDYARPQIPALVVENRLLRLDDSAEPHQREALPPGPPWRIGWYGMLRCRRSLEILASLAQRRPDLVRVRMAGRATGPLRDRLRELARAIPSLEFAGAYGAHDLGRLYADVHFSWAIDYFEENANSEWLLPNRIYEAGSCNAISLALRRTETGRWLDARGLGVLFDDPRTELETFLERTAFARYEALKRGAASAPRSDFIAGPSDCVRLAEALADVVRERRGCAPQALVRAAA